MSEEGGGGSRIREVYSYGRSELEAEIEGVVVEGR